MSLSRYVANDVADADLDSEIARWCHVVPSCVGPDESSDDTWRMM